MAKRLVTLILLSSINFCLMGQGLDVECCFPFVFNYSPADYNSSNTNWSIVQDSCGRIFAANDNGLLIFDGMNWRKAFPFGDNQSVRVRSLHADGDIIYLGAYREFGYFSFDSVGEIHYTSLSCDIPELIGKEDEIWHIIKHGEKVFFLYFNCCYVHDTHSRRTQRINISSTTCFEFDGDLYLSSQAGYTYKWNDVTNSFGPPVPTPANTFILNKFSADGKIYAVTSQSGIIRINDNGTFQRIDGLGPHYPSVNRSILCKDGTIILGTIGHGIMSVGKDGRINWNLNKDSRLQNNDVMYLMEDASGNIWAALDKGISVIHKDGPSFIPAPESAVGKVTAVFKTPDKQLLIGSNNGLYKTSLKHGPEYVPVGKLRNQVWSISGDGDNVFVGGNTGTFLLDKDGRLTRISDVGGGTKVLRRRNGDLVQASFAPVNQLETAKDRWISKSYIKDFYVPADDMLEDSFGNLWIEHMYQGLYRVQKTHGKDSVTCYQSLTSGSRPEKIRIIRLGERLLFSNGKGFHVYDDLNDKIVPYNSVNQRLNAYPSITKASNSTDGLLWVAFEDGRIAQVTNDSGNVTVTTIIDGAGLGIRMLDGNPDVVKLDDGSYIMPIEGGFIAFPEDNSYLKNNTGHLGMASVRATEGERHGGQISDRFLPTDVKSVSLKNKASLEISLFHSYCKYNNSVYVSYILKGYDETARTCDKSMTVNYAHLPHGSYEFTACLHDSLGAELDSISFNVNVRPSFWGSRMAMLMYLFLSSSLAYGIYVFVNHLLKRQRRRMQEAMDKEMIALKNKQLEESLLLKSDDLAKYSLIEAQRNKVLDQLREKITSMRLNESSEMKKSDYMELMRIIEDGGMSSDAWGTFYNNFDLVHDSFFTNLSNKYPSLTQSDLRYCAYLRLNMTTKEIAKATGVTVKGVEAAKGRLRKKMSIPQDSSIGTFLLNITVP